MKFCGTVAVHTPESNIEVKTVSALLGHTRPYTTKTQRKAKATVLGDSEVEDYLDAAEALGYLPMFTLMLTVGLRQRELPALKWSDLDEQTGVLTHGQDAVW